MHFFTSWKRRMAQKKAEERSDEIDLRLKKEAVSFRQVHDVLLMSIPESEAAAFALVKRMKIAHDSYTHHELVKLRPVIWKLLLQHSRNVIMAVQSRNPGLFSRSDDANCDVIMSHRIDTNNPQFSFRPEFSRAVQDLWAEHIAPVLLEQPSRLSVDDNATYFIAEAKRIIAKDYVPSTEDVLHTAEKGILETCFKGPQLSESIRVIQVYGQARDRERKKWIDQFENVTSIVFCASLSDYDVFRVQVAAGEEQTRLEGSFALFEAVVNLHWFLRTPVILFLTDRNDFKTKLLDVPLARYFPRYTGGTDDNEGAEYILQRFKRLDRRERRNVYPYIITQPSDDANNLRLFFAGINEVIFQDALRVAELL